MLSNRFLSAVDKLLLKQTTPQKIADGATESKKKKKNLEKSQDN